jgi:hypothetical protein
MTEAIHTTNLSPTNPLARAAIAIPPSQRGFPFDDDAGAFMTRCLTAPAIGSPERCFAVER